jgi:hypothetical protein
MPKKYIIAEDNNDKYTLEAILKSMANQDRAIVASAETVDWEIRNAENDIENPAGLAKSIESLLKEMPKGKYDKIGLVWDTDSFTAAERILQFNNAINKAINNYTQKDPENIANFTVPLTEINQFVPLEVKGVTVQIGCYFIHHNGRGEMEDLLKAIKTKPSPIADCVDKLMPGCMQENGEAAPGNKDLVKLWINHYQRYDTLAAKNRVAKYTMWENVMLHRSDIFDFNRVGEPALDELKFFLTQLCAE